jgi:hypothetical protein
MQITYFYKRVSCKADLPQVLTIPGLPTHKQEFGNPSLQPSRRCQTHASLPTRTPPSRQLYQTKTIPARFQHKIELNENKYNKIPHGRY